METFHVKWRQSLPASTQQQPRAFYKLSVSFSFLLSFSFLEQQQWMIINIRSHLLLRTETETLHNVVFILKPSEHCLRWAASNEWADQASTNVGGISCMTWLVILHQLCKGFFIWCELRCLIFCCYELLTLCCRLNVECEMKGKSFSDMGEMKYQTMNERSV